SDLRLVLPEGLSDQTLITIYGEPKPNAEKFQINLQKGDDVAFHFNPRFNDKGNQVIVRNTRIKGVWGPEERQLPFFPFTPGRPFVVSDYLNFHCYVDDTQIYDSGSPVQTTTSPALQGSPYYI
uniref:Galectin n=1 Tax=Pygocentrus nattereri TaxID=42514 RepID=A0A3B4D6E1_PYGNA